MVFQSTAISLLVTIRIGKYTTLSSIIANPSRQYKKGIYLTNYQTPERDPLRRESLQQTVRLILLDDSRTPSESSQRRSKISGTNVLTCWNRCFLTSELRNDVDAATQQVLFAIFSPHNPPQSPEFRPSVLFTRCACRSDSTNWRISLRRDLINGYTDYGKHRILTLDSRPLQWFTKFSFNTL